MRLLIVEDEWLIADLIGETVTTAGHSIAGICGSRSAALELIEGEGIDGAFLDANLRGESTEPIARAFQARGIPYLVISGYSETQRPDPLTDAPFLQKPFTPGDLLAKLAVLLSKDR